jgi:alanyl-tRNA synthetase
MTERLYFGDSALRAFEARVASCVAAGDRFEVALDATAFYPTGGGQPHDLGTLGGRAVLDVIDRSDAARPDHIVHVLDGPLEPGSRVTGTIDWARRFDHMQQHSGQHMLSAAFEATANARTESFHLGASTSSIDLDRPLSAEDIARAEDAVNRVVWEDREVRLRFVQPGEAPSLPLRKETGREGILRLIEVEGFDLSACGGTHVSRTGAVGLVSVVAWEKFKGGTRVEFLCGNRALGRLREWRDVFAATNRLLSVLPRELPAAIERLQSDDKAQAKAIRELRERLAVHEAARLVSASSRNPAGKLIVVHAVEDADATTLKALATAAASTPGVRIAVFSTATPALAVVARSSGETFDAATALRQLMARFGGKGGGKPDFAQGGGLGAPIGEILTAARELLSD